jgi:AcrR family transcriptional regulator
MARGQELLLTAAQELFAERGYDRVTTREIAERAGVDATLIARYFGSKAGIYLASLRAELGEGPPPDLLQPDRMAALLGRVDDRGPGPVFQSAVHPHEDEAVQAQAREALHARLVTPLAERFTAAGVEQPQARAEIVAAAFAGIALGRASGSFPELQKLPAEELVTMLQALLGP